MCHNFLYTASFHEQLLEIDTETAEGLRARGCHCGGPLHQATYPRVGFGIPVRLRHFYAKRLSFCCARCRTRTTPTSVRFFGRRRFVATVFILVSLLRLSATDERCRQVARRFGLHLSVSTWKRWRAWWRLRFPVSAFWHEARAHVPPENTTRLPRGVLQAFLAAQLSERVLSLLRFLSPLSVGPV